LEVPVLTIDIEEKVGVSVVGYGVVTASGVLEAIFLVDL